MQCYNILMIFKVITILLCVSMCLGGEYVGDDGNGCDEACLTAPTNSTNDTIFQPNCQNCPTTSRGTVFIAIFVSIFVLLVLICIICLAQPYLREYCKKYSEEKRRKPVAGNLTQAQFDLMLNQFQNIFTESQRSLWSFFFQYQDQQCQMQWFSMQLNRKSTYEATVTMKGQDIRGTWTGNGSYVNTSVGPLFWWFKAYDEFEVENQLLVFQLQREGQGKFQGRWYYSGAEFVEGRSGRTGLRRIGASSQNLNVDLEVPESDLNLN